MINENKNVLIAIVLSLALLVGIEYAFPKKEAVKSAPVAVSQMADVSKPIVVQDALPDMEIESPRVVIASDTLSGSIRLKGALFDHLTLLKYKETTASDSPKVPLLTRDYFAQFVIQATSDAPNAQTVWTADRDTLTPEYPVTLTWTNATGVTYKRVIALDPKYMLTVTDTIDNKSSASVNLSVKAEVVRVDPAPVPASTVHEGFVGVFDGTLKEEKFKKLADNQTAERFSTTGGWVGITDKYWLTALAFDQKMGHVNGEYAFHVLSGKPVFQSSLTTSAVSVPVGQSYSNTAYFLAGPKDINLITGYQDTLGIERFELAIDFGWYYFLTKPFLYLLEFLNRLVGNMGLAILIFATLLRLLLLPIAAKSFVSMAKMRKVQPKVKELQERYKNDKMRLNQEMMALYRKEKINPASGCLPLFIQIPIFFSLYKVLSVSIEMRQAPFFGWITDLSARDPSSVFTLFGLVPWAIPSFLDLGVWPVLMGITMYLQQKMSPQAGDKAQAAVLKWMPLIFVFMLGNFASGLVIYWTWSNILSIIQQRYVMHKYGVDK